MFHVQTVRADLARAREIVRAEQDAGGAGADACVARRRAGRGLGTPAAGAVGLDDGGPHDHIGWMVQGSFASPNLLSPHGAVHGAFLRSAAGDLRVRRMDDVYFTLWVPLGALPGAPLPVVIVQHGLGGERSDALPLANALAGVGYARLRVDAPFQVSRASAAGR